MITDQCIKEARVRVQKMKNRALQLGRLRTEFQPPLDGRRLDDAWKRRGGAFRCMAYNEEIRAINAVEKLISITANAAE